MAYEARGEGTLIIRKKYFGEVIEALKDSFSLNSPRLYANQDWSSIWASDIKSVFDAFGFELSFDDEGNAASVRFPQGAILDVEQFLDAISPWAEDGSEIVFTGEDRAEWRWPKVEKTESDIGEIDSADWWFVLDLDYADELKQDIIQWVQQNGYAIDLNPEDDIQEIVRALDIGEPDVQEEESGEVLSVERDDVENDELNFPIIELLKVLAPYVINGRSSCKVYTDEAPFEYKVTFDGTEMEFVEIEPDEDW